MRAILLTLTLLTFLTPLASAAGCTPTCGVLATIEGYASPVVVVDPAATVTWRAVDVLPHTSTAAGGCFSVSYSGSANPGVTFTASGGNAFAQQAGGLVKQCSGTRVGDHVAVLYSCALHANMRGTVLVKVV